MRFSFLCVPLALLLAASLLFADDFSDFQIPRHTLLNGSAYLSAFATPGRYHNGSYSENRDQYQGNGTTSLHWLSESDDLRRELSCFLQLDGSKNRQTQNYPHSSNGYTVYNRSTYDSHSWDEKWSGYGSFRKYPWKNPWGFEIGGAADLDFGQSKSKNESSNNDSSSYQSAHRQGVDRWTYSYSISASTKFGYGKVRDATVVYDVHVIEKRLLQSGAIKKPLSKQTREKLAVLFFNRDSYVEVHDYYSKFFWQEVERILREDGVLTDKGLDAYNLYRLDEPGMNISTYNVYVNTEYYSTPHRFSRQSGYFAGLAIDASHDHTLNRYREWNSTTYREGSGYQTQDNSTFNRLDYWTDLVWFGPHAEYHLPWGWRWQFDGAGSVQFSTRDPRHDLYVTSTLNAAYQISDRYFFNLYSEQTRTISRLGSGNGDVKYNRWTVALGGGISYFIEDNLMLGLNLLHVQYRQNPPENAWYDSNPSYRSDLFAHLTLSYHFLGQATIAGIANPIHKLPFTVH